MEVQETTVARASWARRFGLALAVIVVGPMWAYLVGGVLYGFDPIEPTFRGVLLSYAGWLGYCFLAAILGVGFSFTRPRAVWKTIVIAFGIMGVVSGLGGQPFRAVPTASAPRAHSDGAPARPAPAKVQVSTVSEFLKPGQEVVTPKTVAIMDAFILDDFNRRQAQLGKPTKNSAGEPIAKVATFRFEDQGHVVYVSELRQTRPAPGEDPVLRVIWNTHDGQFKRVFCLSERDEFVWRSGECGRQLAETFGWPGWHSD